MTTRPRETTYPIGASVTLDELRQAPYATLARLRKSEPVTWVPVLDAWLVTRRDLAIEAMRDAERFTVDDDRFTTARVLGSSMLSLDGPEHTRHRSAFTAPFRPKLLREELEQRIIARAERLVRATVGAESVELRTSLAGPLAVGTILDVLGLYDVDSADVLGWYGAFSDAIVALTIGEPVPDGVQQVLDQLYSYVGHAMGSDDASLIRDLVDDAVLRPDEIPAAVAVVMFGAIETSEAMTANALWHLLTHPEVLDRVRSDRTLIAAAIDESLRLEPAAAVIDRYTTSAFTFGGAQLGERDLVTISLLGANRDPGVFDDPDTYDLDRPNLAQHVTFVQGPHACIGLHVARAETRAALNAVLDQMQGLTLEPEASSAPEGLVFRKATSVVAHQICEA